MAVLRSQALLVVRSFLALLSSVAACLPLLLAATHAEAKIITDRAEVLSILQEARQRQAPVPHHIVWHTRTSEAGRITRRTDEHMADGNARYWRMAQWAPVQEGSPEKAAVRPERVLEQLLMRQGNSEQHLLLDSEQPARTVSTQEIPTMGYPLGYLSLPGPSSSVLSLAIDGDIATLDYQERGRSIQEVLSLRHGLLMKSRTVESAAGRIRTVTVERFDLQNPLPPGWVDPIQRRLEASSRKMTSDQRSQGLWRWISLIVGGLAPLLVLMWVSSQRYAEPSQRQWRPSLRTLFVWAGSTLSVGAVAVMMTDGLVLMILIGVGWSLVQWLPREAAMILAEGIAALLLSSAGSLIAWALLRIRLR